MHIAVPTEVKDHERRVALTPQGAHALVRHGHTVTIQAGAGAGIGAADTDYTAAGAFIETDPDAVWAAADLVLKVKEPVPSEYHRLREGLVLFTYLHLAADRPLTDALLAQGVTSIAYETVQAADGSLPLLAPMSEIAGRLSIQAGAQALMAVDGGAGVLLSGAAGVRRGQVVVLGGGTAGFAAAELAAGMGADVTVMDISPARMRQVEELTAGRVRTLYSTPLAVAQAVADADLVIGAVLVPGARTPHLVTHDMLATMRPGSVLVDIAIDQGGCFADSHVTTHSEPTFTVDGKIFSCVGNMPGAVPYTSTYALTNATLPYALAIADAGWLGACRARPDLAAGLATHAGHLTSAPVGDAFGLAVTPVAQVLG